MLLIVQHAGKSEEVQVEGEAAYVLAQDLSAAIQKTLDVPVHKQKLIFKGKVLENGKPLDSYGVKERSKIMLLASGAVTKDQQVARRAAEERRKVALGRKEARQNDVDQGSTGQRRQRSLSVASLLTRRREKWKSTCIVSLRGLGLTELPDLGKEWDELGPAATAQLYAVDIGNNCLTRLPDAFLSMQGLKRLRCSHNLLTSGTVPWTTLSLLPKLSHLLLDNNRLESINPVICQATSLRVLNVSANLLPDLPSDMHLLQELEQLDVSDNKIRVLPCNLGQCARLKWIQASTNKIEVIPVTVPLLRSLKGLVMDDNRVACIPPGLLKDCLELHTISVRNNPITMQQLRETEGFEAFSGRRKGKLDKIMDAHIAADFTEAADYEQFHRH